MREPSRTRAPATLLSLLLPLAGGCSGTNLLGWWDIEHLAIEGADAEDDRDDAGFLQFEDTGGGSFLLRYRWDGVELIPIAEPELLGFTWDEDAWRDDELLRLRLGDLETELTLEKQSLEGLDLHDQGATDLASGLLFSLDLRLAR